MSFSWNYFLKVLIYYNNHKSNKFRQFSFYCCLCLSDRFADALDSSLRTDPHLSSETYPPSNTGRVSQWKRPTLKSEYAQEKSNRTVKKCVCNMCEELRRGYIYTRSWISINGYIYARIPKNSYWCHIRTLTGLNWKSYIVVWSTSDLLCLSLILWLRHISSFLAALVYSLSLSFFAYQ